MTGIVAYIDPNSATAVVLDGVDEWLDTARSYGLALSSRRIVPKLFSRNEIPPDVDISPEVSQR